MRDPKPINLTDDDYWRNLGWPAVARDVDGHVISTCAKDDDDGTFNEWLRECFEDGLTVTNLIRSASNV
jgi:hypothetical protein